MALIDDLKTMRGVVHENWKSHQSMAYIWQERADEALTKLGEIDIAIAALEAPAQPLDELRSVPGAEEESRDQSEPEIPEGFTKWEGGVCPVDQNVVVRILYRDGVYEDHPAGDVSWSNHGFGEDVAAYRILAAPAPEPEIPEGFTKWEGGEWTGSPTDRVQVIFCDEPTPYFPTEAENLDPLWCWERCPPDAQRIIAYRVAEAPAPEQDASVEVLDATVLPQVTPDEVPPTAEVIHTDDGRKRFALFSGQTHEVVSGSGNPDADFWAGVLHPKPKVDA